jgi:AraC-like DNA-binding protein
MPSSRKDTGAGGRPPATVSVKTLRAALAAASLAGIDAAALLREQGIDPAVTQDPDFRYPHDRWLALWETIATRAGDPGIGLHAAEGLAGGYWDLIDYVIASSATLGDALRRFERYFAIISTGVRHVLRIEGRSARLYRQYVGGASPSRIATEFAFANVALRFRALAARPWSPALVTFTHEPSLPPEEYARVFRCPVQFRAPMDAVSMPLQDLSIPTQRPDPELCALLERHALLLIRSLPAESSLSDRICHALKGELSGGVPALGTIAKRIGVSERTLQRNLARQRVSYRSLVEKTRAELACRYLGDRSLGLAEVGYLVGFLDVSAFYKAFRRWTGITPGSFRDDPGGAAGQSIGGGRHGPRWERGV